MKKYRKLLFDVDNTLLDFDEAERNGIRKVLEAYGEIPDEGKLALYSSINASLWKAYERGEIVRDTIMETRFQLFFDRLGKQINGQKAEEMYRAQLDASAVMIEGAQELLDVLAPEYELYVITNGVSETQYRRLKTSGIDRYMKGIFVSEDAGFQKPRKEFFEYCFSRMEDPDPSGMLVIGDSLSSDIRGGNAAGIDTCWFNRKGESGMEGITVTYEIHRLEELERLLKV